MQNYDVFCLLLKFFDIDLLPAGDLLIIMAQIIVSVQMVLEEKFIYKHNVHPLKAVGTEGNAMEQNHVLHERSLDITYGIS